MSPSLQRVRESSRLSQRGGTLSFVLPSLLCSHTDVEQIYTLEGKVLLGPEGTPRATVEPFYTLVLSSVEGETGIHVESVSETARLVIVAGEPLDQVRTPHFSL